MVQNVGLFDGERVSSGFDGSESKGWAKKHHWKLRADWLRISRADSLDSERGGESAVWRGLGGLEGIPRGETLIESEGLAAAGVEEGRGTRGEGAEGEERGSE